MNNLKEQDFIDNRGGGKFGPGGSSSNTGNGNKFGPGGGNSNKFGPGGGNSNKFGPGTAPAPVAPVTGGVFDCLLNFTDGTKIVKTSSPDQVRQTINADNNHFFYKDNKFLIQDKSGTTTSRGTWKCDGDKDYIINTDDGEEYSSKIGKWKSPDSSSNNNSGGSGSTVVDTTLTGDELKGGKFVKIGMKGKIVGDIQRLLIKLGYTDISKSGNPDDIFGRRTKASVVEFQRNNQIKDDGAVGPETWPKLNDPAAVKKGASSSTSSSSAVSSSNGNETEPGSDIIIKESLKKTLRKNLLKFN